MHLTYLPFYRSELKDAIRDVATQIADEYETETKQERVRKEDERNNLFGAGTDGAIGRDVLVPLSYLSGTGSRSGVEALDKAIAAKLDRLYELAQAAFIRDYPGIQDDLDGKEVCYSNLEWLGRGDLAEIFDEYQDSTLEDEFVTFRIAAFFYGPSNRNSGRKTQVGKAELQFWVGAFLDGGCWAGASAFDCYEAAVTIDKPLTPYGGPRSTLEPRLSEALKTFQKAHENSSAATNFSWLGQTA